MENTNYNKLFGSLIIYSVIFTLLPIGLLSFIKDSSMVLIITAIIAFIPIYFAMGHVEFIHQLTQKRERVNPLFLVLLALAPMGSNIIGGVVEAGIKSILKLFGLSIFNTAGEMASEITSVPTLSVILYTCIIAPLVEELVFRNYLYRKIEKPKPWVAVVTTGIVFAFMHNNFDQSISVIPTGIYFSYLAYRYSIWVPILAHILNNTIFSLSALLVGTEYESVVTNGIFWVGIIASIIVFVSIFRYFKRTRHDALGSDEVIYTKNIFFWLLIIISVAMMFLNEFATKLA